MSVNDFSLNKGDRLRKLYVKKGVCKERCSLKRGVRKRNDPKREVPAEESVPLKTSFIHEGKYPLKRGVSEGTCPWREVSI